MFVSCNTVFVSGKCSVIVCLSLVMSLSLVMCLCLVMCLSLVLCLSLGMCLIIVCLSVVIHCYNTRQADEIKMSIISSTRSEFFLYVQGPKSPKS